MKGTGIVRNIDDLGRVCIPIELRRTLGIAIGDPVEFFVDEDRIVIKRYAPGCIFTGNADDLVEYKGKKINRQAAREIALAAGYGIR